MITNIIAFIVIVAFFTAIGYGLQKYWKENHEKNNFKHFHNEN